MTRIPRLLALVVALLLAAPAAAWGQAGTEVEVVDVNTSRYAEGGRVTMVVEFRNLSEALDAAQVVVTENGEPVPAEAVTVEPIRSSQVPVGVVLVIDTSGSMEGAPMEAAKAAAVGFVQQKRPEDFIALVTFADTAQVLSNFTNSTAALVERINALVPEGGTAMYDGVIKGADLYSGAAPALRRNMIVLTDGTDTNSVGTLEEAIAAVTDRQVRVFGVALQSPDFDPAALQQITETGDGLFLATPNPEELAGLYGQIQRELDNTLVIRFNAAQTSAGELEVGVTYAGSFSSVQTVSVPGYVPPTTGGETQGPTTTFAPAQPIQVVDPLPMDPGTLRLFATLAIFITAGLFLFILLGGNRDDESAFMQRLSAYGRRGFGTQREEKRSLLERLPLLRRFSAAAEEEVRRRGLLSGVNSALEQANIPLSAGEAVLAALGLSGVAGLLAAVFNQSIVAGVVVFGIGILLVFGLINYAGTREKKRFESQLPDTLTLISTSLRAGYSLLQAVEAVAQEAPNPTAREFGRAIAEARLGRPVVQALEGIVERTKSQDFAWAVMAIEIQREVGGNLAEVLQTVADTMLARNRLRGEIKALTAEGRISAFVLGALPFVMALFLWTTNRPYLEPLLQETFGQIAIGVGLLLMVAGIVWLKKIVDIEV